MVIDRLRKILLVSFKWLLLAFLVTFGLIVIYLNFAIFYSPTYKETSAGLVNQDIQKQLNHLSGRMHGGLCAEMQKAYPEGFMFIGALYGLSWSELIQHLDEDAELYQQGLKEIDWTLTQLRSPTSSKIFHLDRISPAYGVFYNGWINYLQAKKFLAQSPSRRDTTELKAFQAKCLEIATAYDTASTPFLESYRNLSWPADNAVCMASLALHDQIFPPQYEQLRSTWVQKAQKLVDPQTSLLPHKIGFPDGETLQGARGSSQSLTNIFLFDVDSSFGRQQFDLYYEQFLDYRFGLPGVREYPKGSSGRSDVDSGPVILGIGGSASIVGIRTMAIYGKTTTAVGLRNCVEAFGWGEAYDGQKRYLKGAVPMADMFIAWACSPNIQEEEKQVGNWRWSFQIYSIITLFILIFMLRRLWKW